MARDHTEFGTPSLEALTLELNEERREKSELKHLLEEQEKVCGQIVAQVKNESSIYERQLQGEYETIRAENQRLRQELQEKNKKIEQLERMRCERNCVLLAILFICTRVPHITVVDHFCLPQLERMIYSYACMKIGCITKIEDLKCEGLMDVLLKCGIVRHLDQYVFTSEMPEDDRDTIIHEAWTKMMTIPDVNLHFLILGRIHKWANGIGHAEICDLGSRNGDSIVIHDPQTNSSGSGNETDFRNYVKNDGGLKLFAVNYDTLKEMLNMFDSLHK